MSARVDRDGLQVAAELAEFLEGQALPGSGVDTDAFWAAFSELLHGLAPKNAALLAKREDLQRQIDQWHIANRDAPHDPDAYKAFLEESGYLIAVFLHRF